MSGVIKLIAVTVSLYCVLVSSEIGADELGVRITSGPWATEYSGFIRDSTQVIDTINLDDDLNLTNNIQSFFYVYMEQPYSVLPNFRIGQTNLTTTGNNLLNKSFSFGNTDYTENQQIRSKLNLDHIEATVYWSIFKNEIGFDLGLNIKDFGGEVILEGATSGRESSVINGTIPMVYMAFDMPFLETDYTVGIDTSYLKYGSAAIFDSLIYIRSGSYYYVGFEAGYRFFQISYGKSPFKAEIKIAGLYLNAYVYF